MREKPIFISDAIPNDEIRRWWSDINVFITGKTGTGKTLWSVETLGKVAKEDKRKILILQNRRATLNQISKEIKDRGLENVIDIKTYQSIETGIRTNNPPDFSKYQYIVWDEVHYAFFDSSFNYYTDKSFEYLIRNTRKQTNILISASPNRIKKYLPKLEYDENFIIDRTYSVDNNYNIIKTMYQFSSEEVRLSLISKIIEECIENNEKALIFINDYNKIEELVSIYREDKRVKVGLATSSSSRLYDNDVKKTLQTIEEFGYFEEDILFTTEVLSTGVSILDKKLKHIMVDSYDIENIKQSIGRKRIEYSPLNGFDTDDTINVYVPMQTEASIAQKTRRDEEKIKIVDYLIENGSHAFMKRLTKNSFLDDKGNCLSFSPSLIYDEDKMYNNKKVVEKTYNKIEYFNLKENLLEYKERKATSYANANRLSKYFDIPKGAIIYVSGESSSNSLNGISMKSDLENLLSEKKGEKLFSDDRKKISSMIINTLILGGKKVETKNLRVSTMNSILYEEFDLNYQFSEEIRETSGINKGKRYNYILELSEEEILENRE